MLYVAPHVSADPSEVGKEFEHAPKADILIGLGSKLRGIGVDGAEPGVGIADVNHHESNAGGAGAFGGCDAPGGVNEEPAFAAARSRPEFDHHRAEFDIAVEQAVSVVVGV